MSREEAVDTCCASCGVAEIDDIKLMPCDDCDLVRYCSDECQRDCEKRVAELRDELLFKQPEGSHMGDCPICSLPLPLDKSKTAMYECCSKVICMGCIYANYERETELRRAPSCPFCRGTFSTPEEAKEEANKLRMKRVEANDPVAMCQEGFKRFEKGEYQSAFELYTKSAELGYVEAHYRLARLYHERKGVEKDEGKLTHHLEEAAIGGHPDARYVLGCVEWVNNNNTERAVKHWIIAATQGEDESIKELMKAFKQGSVSKEELASALRAHKAAVDETKSQQREAANGFEKYRNEVQGLS